MNADKRVRSRTESGAGSLMVENDVAGSEPRRSSAAPEMQRSFSVLSIVGEDATEKHTSVSPNTARLSFLWAAYSPEFWYWEVIETTRRLMLTAVLSVVEPGSAQQSVMSILLAQFYLKVYAYNVPYGKATDNTLAEIGQYQIFFTFFAALIIQNGLLHPVWDEFIGVFLILINLGVVFYCFSLDSKRHCEEAQDWCVGKGATEKEGADEDAGEDSGDAKGDGDAPSDGIQMASIARTSVDADVV